MEVIHAPTACQALALTEPQLAAAGAEGEMVYGMLRRLSVDPSVWGDKVTILVGVSAGQPVALSLQTGPYPAHIVGFVDEDQIDFSALLTEYVRLNHTPSAVVGAVRCSVPFAEVCQRELGVLLRTFRDLIAFELHELHEPTHIVGSARVAYADDADLLLPWCEGFARDIGEPFAEGEADGVVARHTSSGDMLLWVVDDGPVSMAAINRRTPSSSCVAWVYTPPQLRGRGYASAVVAAITRRELEAGALWCSLCTDAANPTSNHIYTELGYQPRCEFRHISLVSE